MISDITFDFHYKQKCIIYNTQRIMKKTYDLHDCLSVKEVQQFHILVKKLCKYCVNQKFQITNQWTIFIFYDTVQLQLTKSPFPHGEIIKNQQLLPSIANDLNEQYSLAYSPGKIKKILHLDQSKKDNIFIKLLQFINIMIKKNNYYGERQIKFELEILGYLKFNKFKVEYYNKMNQLKWTLGNYSRPSHSKLDTIFKMQYNRNVTNNDNWHLLQKYHTISTMNRKFSQQSFKQYQIIQDNNFSKQRKQTQNSLNKTIRSKSLPSLNQQYSKIKHKQIINKIEKIKQNSQKEKEENKIRYLKTADIQPKDKRKRLLSLNGSQKKNMNNFQNIQNKLQNFAFCQSSSSGLKNMIDSENRQYKILKQKLQDKKIISSISIKGGTQKINIEEEQLIKNVIQELGGIRCETQKTIKTEQNKLDSLSFTESNVQSESKDNTPSNLSKLTLKSFKLQQQKKQKLMISHHKGKQISIEVRKSGHFSNNFKTKLVLRDHAIKQSDYSELVQQQLSKKNANYIKKNIKDLLHTNMELAQNNELINDLYFLYEQKIQEKLIQQNLQQKIKKKIHQFQLSYIKTKNKQNIQPKQLQFSKIIKISHHFLETHQNNRTIQNLIKQITQSFNKKQLQSKYLNDPSHPDVFKSIKTIYDCFLLHKFQINEIIDHLVQQLLQKQEYQNNVKQKFEKFKFKQTREKNQEYVSNLEYILMQEIAQRDEISPPTVFEQENKMKIMLLNSIIERRKMLRKYYYENHFMPYFYMLSLQLTRLFFTIFAKIDKNCSLILIQLNNLFALKQTIANHIDQIETIYNFFIQFFEQIPHTCFKLQTYQIKLIRDYIDCRKQQILTCEQNWQKQLIVTYSPYEQFLQNFNLEFEKIKQQYRKNQNNLLLRERQQQIKRIQIKLQKLIKVKTFLRCKQFVLDTQLAKQNLIKKYETALSRIFQDSFQSLNQISISWSQQMARTQRLMTEQIAEEENEIIAKIKFYAKQYYSLTKFYIFNQKYIKTDQITQQSSPNNKEKKILSPKQLEQNFTKCLYYSYNMSIKNQEKIAQISFLVQKYKEKVLFVSKALQVKSKDMKLEYDEISRELKKIIRQTKVRQDIMSSQIDIKRLQNRFAIYLQNSNTLHEEMAKNGMIIWEDDEFLTANLNICAKTIAFMESQIYRRVTYNAIDTIRFQHIFKYYKALQKLMIVIANHKFEQFFKNQYDLTKRQFQFIEMALYKDYTVTDIEELHMSQGLDLRPTITSLKMIDLIKLFRNRPAIYKGVSKIYYKRKQDKYLKVKDKPIRIQFELSEQKEGSLIKLKNLQELIIILEDEIQLNNLSKNQIEMRKEEIKNLYKLMEIHDKIQEHHSMLRQIGNDMKEQDHLNILMILQKLKLYYHNALKTFQSQRNANISKDGENGSYNQKQWEKLINLSSSLSKQNMNFKFYNYLSQMCSRLIMLPNKQLIHLMDWSTQANIVRNVGIIFPQIIDVEFGDRNQIVAMLVSRGINKDRIEISSGPIGTDKQDKKGKLIRIIQKQVHKSLLLMVGNSNGRTGQIKILSWLLYFTEQVEQSIITNCSLKILEANLHDTILSIKSDLRYDICKHKEEEICQLNVFMHYIRDYLGQFPKIESFQWQATIRAYEKNNCVMIQQSNFQFYYGFEPKSIKILHQVNWNLGLCITYGDERMKQLYRFKAYILASPYFQIKSLKQTYFAQQKNINKLLLSLEANNYVCTIFEQKQNQSQVRTIFNQIHKQILHYFISKANKSKRSDSYQSFQPLNPTMQGKYSLLFCYNNYQNIPVCFLSIYKCKNRTNFDPDCLNIQINILAQCSNLSGSLKLKLIWKLIKLIKALNSIKNSSSQQLISIVKITLRIIQKYGTITKEAKNEIYCYIVQNLLSNYTIASSIINQIFKPQDIETAQFTESSNAVAYCRKDLLNKINQIYNQITLSNLGVRKPILIYGEQPSCKTTFITQFMKLRLNQNGGYIEGSETKYKRVQSFQIEQKVNECPQRSQYENYQTYYAIQAGTLSQISPQILSLCHLIYVPPLAAHNSQQFEDQLKIYFQTQLIKIDQMMQKSTLQKMWQIILTLHQVYLAVQKSRQTIKITHLIDQIFRVYSYFAQTQYQIELNDINKSQSQAHNEHITKQQIHLCFLVCYQLIAYSFIQKSLKKVYNQAVRRKLFHKNIKLQFKIQQCEIVTYTYNKQIIKYEPNQNTKKNSIKNQTNYFLTLMTKQAYAIKRYLEMGLNVLAHGNSEHMFNVLVENMEQSIGKQSSINLDNALAKQRRVQLCQQQEPRIFKVRTNMDNFRQTYQNINKISVKKRARMAVSRGMISGKIMELSSRAVIDNSNFNSHRKDNCKAKSTAEQSANTQTLVVVEDLHLGDILNVAELAAMLSRNTNQNYFWPERDQEIFFIFNNYTSGHLMRTIPDRLYRHNAIVSLPDLLLPSIFKYRAQLMISQDQSNLPMQLYRIGVFGFNSQFSCHSPYPSYAPNKQKQIQDIEGFAKNINEGNKNYMQFAIETTLKLPSQFYSKYVVNKLCQNMLSAYHCLQLNQDKQTDNPAIILNRMASLLRTSESTNKLAQRYMPNVCTNDPNTFYIRERNGQWLEMDSKGIELQASKYISTLPYTQRLLGQNYIKYLWLVLSSKVVIVKNDFNHLIGSMCAHVTHRRYKELSRNFYKQIIQAVQELLKSKELNLVFGVPQYLLQHPSFVGFLSSLLENSQIVIQNEPLFDFWWECVEQQQFIENRYNQYHFLKKQIEQAILNRICFIINISDMQLHHIADLICVQKKYDKQHSKDNVSQSIDQNILNPYAATVMMQLGLNKRIKGSINKYCNQHLYKLFKKVLYINTTFQKQQQLCLIDELLKIYIQKNKPTQLAVPYMELSSKYLKMIIQQVHTQDNNSSSIYHTSKKYIAKQSNAELENYNLQQKQQNQFIQQSQLGYQDRNKKSEVFHKVYESIDRIMMSITEIFEQSKKKEKENRNNNVLSQRVQIFKTNLMINKERENITVAQQVLRLQRKIQEWQQSKKQYQSLTMIYTNYSANLLQQLTQQQQNKEKANGYGHEIGKKEQVEQSHFDYPPIQKFKNIKKGRYISEQFSHLKDNFIQINCKCGDETVKLPNLTHIKINKAHAKQQDSQSLKETLKSCLVESNSAQLLNYLEVHINFVRIRRVDKYFIHLLTITNGTQFQKIVQSLSAYRQFINNYQSLMRCLQFCYRISQFFKPFIRGNQVVIDNQKIEEQTILAQYKFAEYICLLDILTTCKTIRNNIELKLNNIEKATKILIDCVEFLKEVGNSQFNLINCSSKQEIAEKHTSKNDLLIKLKIYELISGQILSAISNNANIHFTIYKQLQLQKPQNILMVLQYPNFMYPYKWQQIQNQIFNPLLDLKMKNYESKSIQLFQGVSTIGKISKNNLANFINIRPGKAILDKRLSIQFNYNYNHFNSDMPENEGKIHGTAPLSNTIQTNLNLNSNLNLNKFIIVYDPYIFLPKFISAECSAEDASYRKIICLSNRKQSETQCEQNQKILKINHLPTYYMFYFNIQTKKTFNQYQQTLCKLNQIILLLNRKQKKGQGHNDKLIIVVKHKYLCEDIKNNANFAVDGYKNTPNQNSTNNKGNNDTHIFSENLYNSEQLLKNRVKIVHLQLTEMDIIQFLKYGDKKQEKNSIKDEMGAWKRQIGVDDWEKDKRIKNIGKSSCSISGLSGFILKQQQNLHSQFYLCKQYLKSLIAQVLNQDESQNKYSLEQINNALSRYYQLKQEVLDEFRLKKLIDYDYYLNRQNLCALRCLYTALHFLASNLMLPMDFIWEIGNFTSLQPFIQILTSNKLKVIKKGIRHLNQTKINQSDHSETKFLIHKQSQKLKSIKFINELFEEYKHSFSNKMNSIERNLVNIQPQKFDAESKKVLQQQIGHYQFFIIIYNIFESWIIKNLLDQYDRSNITIIFDYEPNSFQMYLNFISNPPRIQKKIIFFVHHKHMRNIKDLIHCSRIFWI